MANKAKVTIEEAQLGDRRWGVFIERPTRILSRTLWERYATQAEAQVGARYAVDYLIQRGEA